VDWVRKARIDLREVCVFHALNNLQFQQMINLALVASRSALLFK
jgi:hypothetical protein